MNVSPDAINHVFAILPWILFIGFAVAVYLATRHESDPASPIGKTYACATCGRRGDREHMSPVNRDGSVVWYCARCAPQ